MTAITLQGKTFQTHQWQSASWGDYLAIRDDVDIEKARLFFNHGWLWVDMGLKTAAALWLSQQF